MRQINKNTGFHIERYPAIRGLFLGLPRVEAVVEYQEPVLIPQPELKSNSNKSGFLKTAWNWTLNLIIILAFGASTVWFGPKLYDVFFPNSQEIAQAQELQGNFDLEINQRQLESQEKSQEKQYLPPKNENLPEGDWLIIPRIGVRSQLQETVNYKDALETGLWLAPEFGEPGDQKLPMIVAGHRFGFEWWWQDDYWKYHSFYLLPELEPGDRIEVISDQRKWIYEVYAGEEGPEITDYQADMIVYTCKYLDSPTRIFRYAKLIVKE